MTYENTHLYLADQIRTSTGIDDIKRMIDLNIDFYRLGSIFPDIFYYSRCKNVSKIAYDLHGENGLPTNRFVFDVLERIMGTGDEKNLAFILGYVTHCAVDITLHPVVYYLAGFMPNESKTEKKQSSYLHWHYETCIDAQVNDHYFLQEMINPDDLKNLLALRFVKVRESEGLRALNRQIRFFGVIRKQTYYKIFRLLSKIGIVPHEVIGGFYPNMELEKRRLPEPIIYRDVISGEEKQMAFTDLMSQAIQLGVRMIESAFDFYSGKISREDCEKTISGFNLFTGWPEKTKYDMRYSRINSTEEGFRKPPG